MDVAFLIGVIAVQTGIVAGVPMPWGAVVPLGGVAVALGVGVRIRTIGRTLRAILFITIPVLLIRLVAMTSMATVLIWGDYAGRLIAAALVAAAYLHARRVRGVQRGLSAVVALLPGTSGRAAADVVRSALFLLPEISRRMKGSLAAARIRNRRGPGSSPVANAAAVTRATLLSVSTVPRGRAEAMVIRRIIE